MTTAADDSTVEDAFEALLAGRPAPDEVAGLAAFTEAVRMSATSPGRPNAALADLLATGLLVDQSSPSARTARSAGAPPSRRSRVRIRRRFAMLFPALLAKFLSAGAIAQASAGAGVVLVAFTGAGTAGVLPGGVQDTFSTVVAVVTPFEAPTSEEDPLAEEPVDETPVAEVPVVEVPVEEVPVVETPVEEPVDAAPVEPTEETWAAEGPAAYPSFGAWVSFGSNRGWADGATVSCWAHHRNDERKGREVTECAPEDGDEVVTAPETEAPEVEVPEGDTVETQQSSDDGDRRGNGNGNGNGRGQGNGNGNGNGRN